MRVTIAATVVALSACAGDMFEISTGFHPRVAAAGGKSFTFIMRPEAIEHYGSEEAAREQALGWYLAKHDNFCNAGYEITNRSEEKGEITLEGRCR